MTWWADYRNTWMNLTTLGTPDWKKPKGGRTYQSSGLQFHESEIGGNFDEVEEQVWAYRNGLANIAITIKVSPRRYPNPRKKRVD